MSGHVLHRNCFSSSPEVKSPDSLMWLHNASPLAYRYLHLFYWVLLKNNVHCTPELFVVKLLSIPPPQDCSLSFTMCLSFSLMLNRRNTAAFLFQRNLKAVFIPQIPTYPFLPSYVYQARQLPKPISETYLASETSVTWILTTYSF